MSDIYMFQNPSPKLHYRFMLCKTNLSYSRKWRFLNYSFLKDIHILYRKHSNVKIVPGEIYSWWHPCFIHSLLAECLEYKIKIHYKYCSSIGLALVFGVFARSSFYLSRQILNSLRMLPENVFVSCVYFHFYQSFNL